MMRDHWTDEDRDNDDVLSDVDRTSANVVHAPAVVPRSAAEGSSGTSTHNTDYRRSNRRTETQED